MGLLTEFFVATREEADRMDIGDGPTGFDGAAQPNIAALKWVDSVKLGMLESILSGVGFDKIVEDLHNGYVRFEDEQGPWLTGVRPTVTSALATLPESAIQTAAAQWAETEEWQQVQAEASELEETIAELRAIAQVARETDRELYLWTSL